MMVGRRAGKCELIKARATTAPGGEGAAHVVEIRCLTCGQTSAHPDDIKYRYCDHCHIFMSEESTP